MKLDTKEDADVCQWLSAMGEGVFADGEDDAIGGNGRYAMKAGVNLMQEI